jgi:hypothetical protein
MKFNQLLNRSKELASPKGKVLADLHLMTWERLRGLRFTDQVWIVNNLMSSIKKRQEIHYCRRCRHAGCTCKRRNRGDN